MALPAAGSGLPPAELDIEHERTLCSSHQPVVMVGPATDAQLRQILIGRRNWIFYLLRSRRPGADRPAGKRTSTDFVSFYAAGSLANAGSPELAYDQSAHYAAEENASQSGIVYNYFYYPPPFLLLCSAFARLPYLAAFIGFEALSLALYVLIMRRILRDRGWETLVPILAFPPVLWTIGIGQNGFLTAGLFGVATLLVDRRPFGAGLFGALICKPHFALLVPALAAGGRWRAFCGALVCAVGLFPLSLVIFGWQTWHAFLFAAAGSGNVYASGRIPFGGFVTPFGGAMVLGAAPRVRPRSCRCSRR